MQKRKRTKAQLRDIYLAAAEYIEFGIDVYSCLAVAHSAGESGVHGQITDLYATVMCPQPEWVYSRLETSDIYRALKKGASMQAAQDFRVLLLCMMAAAVGDLPSPDPK